MMQAVLVARAAFTGGLEEQSVAVRFRGTAVIVMNGALGIGRVIVGTF